MRKPLVAGNWKMNTLRAEAVKLAQTIADRAAATPGVEIALCLPFVYLDAVRGVVEGTPVGLGAQNMYHEAKGAFTGEISAAMLVDMGCRYVILGHSERRHVFGETDQQINRKVHAALAAGLIPIVCVGERLEERESGQTAAVIRRQFEGSLTEVAVDGFARAVIAYEPVWAIGTGRTATPEQAEEVHSDLRNLVAARYNADVAAKLRIQYGGSVTAQNAAQLLAQPNVDGALVGGASLKADEFLAIISAAASSGKH